MARTSVMVWQNGDPYNRQDQPLSIAGRSLILRRRQIVAQQPEAPSTTVPETPEQKARHEIDAKLIAWGWLVQNWDELDLTAGRGIAVLKFPVRSGFGLADYLLYLDRVAPSAATHRFLSFP